jgi:hypothetical protein
MYGLTSSSPPAGRLCSTPRTPHASEGGFQFPRGWLPPGEVATSPALAKGDARQAQSPGACTDIIRDYSLYCPTARLVKKKPTQILEK